eukprot:m.573247 g.573247  ORF g.573247 m.573247 type:complete len:302 (+) comp57875_c0_seq3:31-936(+)
MSVAELSAADASTRASAYAAVVALLKENGPVDSDTLDAAIASNCDIIIGDMRHSDTGIAQAAVKFLGVVSRRPCFELVSMSEQVDKYLSAVIALLNNCPTTDKVVCSHALWVITVNKWPVGLIAAQLDAILKGIVSASEAGFDSVTVEFETLNAIQSLLACSKGCMSGVGRVSVWAPLVYLRLVSPAIRVRERALQLLEDVCVPILSTVDSAIAPLIASHLVEVVLPRLKTLWQESHYAFVVHVWRVIVLVLSRTLHRTSELVVRLINDMLDIIVPALTTSLIHIQTAAYAAWETLLISLR